MALQTSPHFFRPGHLSAAFYLGCISVLIPACVVTTYEGPSEPPRVPVSARAAEETEAAADPGPIRIAASHILVAYQGAQSASPDMQRSKPEAQLRAQKALLRAQQGEAFELLVTEYSDEPGAATRKGALGQFTRTQMVRPFADAAFALKKGDLSAVVESPFGFHIILRTE